MESRAKRVHPLFNNRFKGRSTEEGEKKEEEEEEEERWKDGGVGWRAGIFALRYVVARLISRIPGKGACDRGKKEKRIPPRLPDTKEGRGSFERGFLCG